jgi:hydrocephalus-inducing protein
LSGKKAEMIFEYTPDLPGTHESYWTFEIPSEKIIQYFLVVGDVVEPNIFFDVGKINFGPLLLGGKNKEIVMLKNLEEVPLAFNFERESIKGEIDSGNSLSVEPMNGVVPAGGNTKIEVLFEPKVSKEFNYNLTCNVKRRTRPICMNVKGIGYVLSHSVYINDRPNALNKAEKC